MIAQFEEMFLSLTEFRKNMSETLDTLMQPRILMSRDKPKAVIVPYETFKAMEVALDEHLDEVLGQVAAKRINDPESNYIAHEDFWSDLGVD